MEKNGSQATPAHRESNLFHPYLFHKSHVLGEIYYRRRDFPLSKRICTEVPFFPNLFLGLTDFKWEPIFSERPVRSDGRTADGRTDRRADDGRTGGRTVERTGGRSDGRTVGPSTINLHLRNLRRRFDDVYRYGVPAAIFVYREAK